MTVTTSSPTAENHRVIAFNAAYPVGTPVRYWKGAREGDGRTARTRTAAQLLSGHTAVVWLDGVSGCIALTHVQPISEDELIPEQPDGIEDDSYDLPDPHRAAERVREWIAAWGDGLIDTADGHPLYARDLEAICRAVLATLGSVSPHAQDGIRPAAWEQQAIDTVEEALNEGRGHRPEFADPAHARQLAVLAVRAIIDTGLAGHGGRCRKCGSGFPRTLPAGQDPLCWTCGSEEQTGPDPDAAEQVLRDRIELAIRNRLDATYPIQLVNDETLDQVAAVAAVAAVNELRQG